MRETAEALDDVAMLLRVVQIVRIAQRLEQLDRARLDGPILAVLEGHAHEDALVNPSDLSRPESTAARAIAKAAGSNAKARADARYMFLEN